MLTHVVQPLFCWAKTFMKKISIAICLLFASLTVRAGTKLLNPTNVPHGSVLPATCSQGDFFQKTNATTGQQLYSCESTNNWLQEGGGTAGTGSPFQITGQSNILSLYDNVDGISSQWDAIDFYSNNFFGFKTLAGAIKVSQSGGVEIDGHNKEAVFGITGVDLYDWVTIHTGHSLAFFNDADSFGFSWGASSSMSGNVQMTWPLNGGTTGQALISNGAGATFWGTVSTSGDNFGSHIATKPIDMGGFAINNSSCVTTSSMSVTGATTTFNNVNYVWPTVSDVGTSTALRLFQYDPATRLLTWPVAVTDGARFGGVSGSSNTWTARNDMGELRLNASAAPTITASISGEIAYDTTDGVLALTDGTTTYAASHSTQTYTVTIASTTGAGSGGWDSLAWPVFNTPVQVPISIQSVWATVKGGTSVIYNLDIRPFGSLATETGTDNVFSSSQTATTSGIKTVVLNKAYCAAGSHVVFKTPTSASSGTVGSITLSINYIEVKE